MNGRILRLLRPLCWLAALTLLGGCFSSSSRFPAGYHLTFLAHPQINASAPLKVSVLLLSSDADFMAADFWSLQSRTQPVLGGNLLHKEQLYLRPGQLRQDLSGTIVTGARYLGIIAEYPSPDGKMWRLSLPLTPPPRSFPFWPGGPEDVRAEIIVDISGVRVLR